MAKKKKKEPTAQITPYLLYRDAGSALDFLKKAFGFSEYGSRFKGEDGAVTMRRCSIPTEVSS